MLANVKHDADSVWKKALKSSNDRNIRIKEEASAKDSKLTDAMREIVVHGDAGRANAYIGLWNLLYKGPRYQHNE